MKTSRADFAEFKRECKRYIDLFSLGSYNTVYMHKDDNDETTGFAWCATSQGGMSATLGLCKNHNLGDFDVKHSNKECALHEVLELLLSRYNALSRSRFATDDELESARHEVIQRIINAMRHYEKGL